LLERFSDNFFASSLILYSLSFLLSNQKIMNRNFDEIIDRRFTGAVKIEGLKTIWGREDLLPLWVADMDFRTPSFITEALRNRLDHGILGYSVYPDTWYSSIQQWLEKRHGWKVQRENIGFVPGIVPGIALAIKCFTREGDKIMVQPPVYHPFFSIIKRNKRQLVYNSLVLEEGQYRMDFEKMERDIQGCKLFILCNPHNPAGRVWSKEELSILADICKKNGVMVVSDEIHADLTFPSFQHTCFARVSESAATNSIIFMSPSKAFNIPGLATSYYISENADIFSRFDDYLGSSELDNGNIFAFIGSIAAYTEGEKWLGEVLDYINENIDFVENFLQEGIPVIEMIRPQASFLIWLDCRKLNFTQEELVNLFVDKAHLALNDGTMFGEREGTGFMRINVACPKSVLEQAMRQLKQAVDSL
jgi:cystathionine beta-lyase